MTSWHKCLARWSCDGRCWWWISDCHLCGDTILLKLEHTSSFVVVLVLTAGVRTRPVESGRGAMVEGACQLVVLFSAGRRTAAGYKQWVLELTGP